jgi:two-component system response regulator PrrA
VKRKKQGIDHLRPEENVTALAASDRAEDIAFLRGVFGNANWTLYEAPTVHQAIVHMEGGALDLIITDRDLPEGGWRRLLDALKPMPVAPLLIVTSRLTDEYLWAEVLNEGGYDVLAQPFDHDEVVRVISAAARRHHNAWMQARGRKPLVLTAGL